MTDKQAKHTPGPWRVDSFDRAAYVVPEADGMFYVAACETIDCDPTAEPEQYGDIETVEANARLIAAAPMGLDLARKVAEHFAGTDAPLGAEAREFIAKATS